MASISIKASLGKRDAWITDRAGKEPDINKLSIRLLSSLKLFKSLKNTVNFTTSCRVRPTSFRIDSMFRKACRACSLNVDGSALEDSLRPLWISAQSRWGKFSLYRLVRHKDLLGIISCSTMNRRRVKIFQSSSKQRARYGFGLKIADPEKRTNNSKDPECILTPKILTNKILLP